MSADTYGGQNAGERLKRGTMLLSVLSLASPAAGLAVESALGLRFGASQVVDGFRVASLVLVFASQLCFGHLLPNVLAPLFLEYEAQDRPREAWSLVFWLAVVLGCACGALVGVAWFRAADVVGVLAPGLRGAGLSSAVFFTRYFALALLFNCFSGVMNGILTAKGVVWFPALSQLMANLTLASFIILGVGGGGPYCVAYGILTGAAETFCLHAGGMLRWAALPPGSLRHMIWPWPQEGLKRAALLSAPLLLMLLVMQWGTMVVNRALSFLPEGALAEFGYAWKLLTLAGMVAASFATAIFPLLAEAHGRADRRDAAALVATGLRGALFLSLPLAAVLFVLRVPVVQLILGRGAMDADGVAGTAQAFGALVVGSPATALMLVLFKVFYSQGRNRVALGATVVSTAIVTLVVAPASRHWGILGVAAACTVGNWLVAGALVLYESRRLPAVGLKPPLGYCARLILMTAGIGASAAAVLALPESCGAVGKLAAAGLGCTAAGWALARALGITEADSVLGYLWLSLKRVVWARVG